MWIYFLDYGNILNIHGYPQSSPQIADIDYSIPITILNSQLCGFKSVLVEHIN